MSNLTFQNTTLTVVPHNNQTYLTATDLARALQYKSVDAVTKIYTRNEDEFTVDMSETVKLTVSGNLQTTVRIFSLRGAHLIAMFSRTPVAKDFRKWVLDILDKEAEKSQNSMAIQPVVKPKFSRELTKEQWLRFASLWFACYNNLELLGKLWKPLEQLGSPHSVKAYTHCTEYQMLLGVMQRQLVPLLAEFEVNPREERHFHHVLKILREYKPKGLGKLVNV